MGVGKLFVFHLKIEIIKWQMNLVFVTYSDDNNGCVVKSDDQKTKKQMVLE